MPSDTHRHDHDHAEDAQKSGGSCCGSAGTCGDIVPTTPAPTGGRSFQVSGLDCAEEVAILNKVVGPKIGGAEHLAFDVINGRMTILDSATATIIFCFSIKTRIKLPFVSVFLCIGFSCLKA